MAGIFRLVVMYINCITHIYILHFYFVGRCWYMYTISCKVLIDLWSGVDLCCKSNPYR